MGSSRCGKAMRRRASPVAMGTTGNRTEKCSHYIRRGGRDAACVSSPRLQERLVESPASRAPPRPAHGLRTKRPGGLRGGPNSGLWGPRVWHPTPGSTEPLGASGPRGPRSARPAPPPSRGRAAAIGRAARCHGRGRGADPPRPAAAKWRDRGEPGEQWR